MSKYDGKFIAVTLDSDIMNITIIPQTEEKYTCTTKKVSDRFSIKFIDSYHFMSTSLRKLVDITPQEKLIHTSLYYNDTRKFEIANKKNFFPYVYLDNVEKLKEHQVPPIDAFYSSLSKCGILQCDYEFAQRAWNVLECETLKDIYYSII